MVSSGDNPGRFALVSAGTFDLPETLIGYVNASGAFPGRSAQPQEAMANLGGAFQSARSFRANFKLIQHFSQVTSGSGTSKGCAFFFFILCKNLIAKLSACMVKLHLS